MDKLPADMAQFKEHAEKHGFHLKYWGQPYGVAENIVVVCMSGHDLGAWAKMNQTITLPYDGQRTILAQRT